MVMTPQTSPPMMMMPPFPNTITNTDDGDMATSSSTAPWDDYGGFPPSCSSSLVASPVAFGPEVPAAGLLSSDHYAGDPRWDYYNPVSAGLGSGSQVWPLSPSMSSSSPSSQRNDCLTAGTEEVRTALHCTVHGMID